MMQSDRFLDLPRVHRRLLCCAAYGGIVATVPMYAMGGTLLHLLTIAAIAVSVAAYLPLNAFLEGLDQVALSRDYEDDDRLLATGRPGRPGKPGRPVDELENKLRTRSLYHTRFILGIALVGTVLYGMFATQFGWWLPSTIDEWAMPFVNSVWLFWATPTIVACWLERGGHNLPYPGWED